MPRLRLLASLAVLSGLSGAGLWAGSAAAALSAADKAVYQAAFAAADDQRWPVAVSAAASARDKTLADVVTWERLQDKTSNATFAEIAAFVTAHPTWPSLDTLRSRAEEAMTGLEGTDDLLHWFAANPPFTGHGKYIRALALASAGRQNDAITQARNLWVSDSLGSDDEAGFLIKFGTLLNADLDDRRADAMLWDGNLTAAKRLLPRLDPAHQALVNARLALIGDASNAETMVRSVPALLQDDPGLLFDRVHYDRVHDRLDDAATLLASPNANKGRPQKWWKERSTLIRTMLTSNKAQAAYQLATYNGLRTGWPAGEAEWLAGWIALEFLKQPQLAVPHFQAMLTSVTYPTSVSRAAYWAGRAAEASGYADIATSWYQKAAEQPVTFYGQLAMSKLGASEPMALPPDPIPTEADQAALDQAPMTKVVRQLAEIGRPDLAKPFLVHIVDDNPTPGLYVLAVALSREVGRVDAGVIIARKAVRDGLTLANAAFPVLRIDYPAAPEKALILSIIRQESNFQTDAASGAGALGLMQLIPATAKRMAKDQGLPASNTRLLTDPQYNVQLGSAYLAHLVDQMHGSYAMAVAGYNAGPGRSIQWAQAFGDPRQGQIDMVDWIELIPFQETRNYVQRVMESVAVYRAMLGQSAMVDLAKDLAR